jgi:hypothetical protein
MGARTSLTVELENYAGNTLRVSFDHAADADNQVDLHSDAAGGRMFSVSLDDLEQFALLLAVFIEHHRDAAPPDNGEQ